jgi:glucose-6-phosphate 1-dehydrogenase
LVRRSVHSQGAGDGVWCFLSFIVELVPPALQCGKALNERKAEIRIQLKKPPNTLYPSVHNNEIVIRIQPNEAMWIKVAIFVVIFGCL